MIRIKQSERYSSTKRLNPYINKWRNRWKEEKTAIHEMKTKLRFGKSCNQITNEIINYERSN